MALPSLNDLKFWVGTLFTKDDWDYNFSKIVSWFSDGTADLVVNSVKSANGIDLDGGQITNLGPATSGSQAVNLDQATTLLNRTSYYYPFSIASGKVDSNGNGAYLQKDSDTQVTVLAGNTNPDLVCIQSDGTVESVTSNTVLTVPATDGKYHIIKEKGQSITLTAGSSNQLSVGFKFPTSQSIGDYFLDISAVPFQGYKYTVNGWENTPFCTLGYVTVSSGVASIFTRALNFNNYDVNNTSEARTMVTDWGLPDLTAGTAITSGWVAPKNGWINAQIGTQTGMTYTTLGIDNVITLGNYTDDSHEAYTFFPISAGQTFLAYSGTLRYAVFYPLKGVK